MGFEQGIVAKGGEDRRKAPQRAEDRYFLHGETAQANWAGESHKVGIVNISPSGIMISALISPHEGEPIELVFASGDKVACTVRWVIEGRIGLEYAGDMAAPDYVRENIAATRAGPHAISGRRLPG